MNSPPVMYCIHHTRCFMVSVHNVTPVIPGAFCIALMPLNQNWDKYLRERIASVLPIRGKKPVDTMKLFPINVKIGYEDYEELANLDSTYAANVRSSAH